MKKILLFASLVIIVLIVFGSAIGIFTLSSNITFWLDEGDPGFEHSVEVKRVLEQVLPARHYVLRYYKKHHNPIYANSLYIQYTDTAFNKNNTEKYVDTTNNSGEFVLLGYNLCQNSNLRQQLKYNLITFHVVSSDSGVREYYENTWRCSGAEL